MVKELSSNLRVPLFVKIRLLNTIEESVELCQQLVDAGAALIAIHARYRVNLVGRSGPGARCVLCSIVFLNAICDLNGYCA